MFVANHKKNNSLFTSKHTQKKKFIIHIKTHQKGKKLTNQHLQQNKHTHAHKEVLHYFHMQHIKSQ
jgi:hypothetical protein